MFLNDRQWIWTAGLVVFLLCSVSGAAHAGTLGLQFDLNSVVPVSDLSDRYGSEYGVGLDVDYMFNDYVGMLAMAQFQRFSRDNRSDADLSVVDIVLDAQIAYPFLDKFRGFIAAGMGLYIWDAENTWWTDGNSHQSADIGFNCGMGLGYRVWKNLDIVTRVFGHRVKFKDNDDYLRWVDYSLGARWTF